jgi:hypothetical protein
MSSPEKEFILNPDNWPQWPILPMKKPQPRGFPEFGFLYSRSLNGPFPESPVTLFKGLIFDLSSKPLKDIPSELFESVDKLLEAGWVVD